MAQPKDLIPGVTAYVKEYMNHFDGSHDFQHILRVVGLAHEIYEKTVSSTSSASAVTNEDTPAHELDLDIITLGALLHDVGDRKYLKEGEDGKTMVRDLLLGLGAKNEVAQKVQTICSAVSYSEEVKDLSKVTTLIERYPELAVVQDADRLDALGAVGVGRVFTYGGAREERSMGDSVEWLELKLGKLEGMMKTDVGRQMAKVRTERLWAFSGWWNDEIGVGKMGERVLGVYTKDEMINGGVVALKIGEE